MPSEKLLGTPTNIRLSKFKIQKMLSDLLFTMFGHPDNEAEYSWQEIGRVFLLFMIPVAIFLAAWVYAKYFWQP